MHHGLNNDFLYSAYRIDCAFADAAGSLISCGGTGFWINDDRAGLILVTNRHVVDIGYAHDKYQDYTLRSLQVSGKVKDSAGLPVLDQTWTVIDPKVDHSSNHHNDIACLVSSRPLPMLDSPSRIDFWIPHKLFATAADFTSRVVICDFVAFPGFPEWHDKANNRPILRSGTIASDPRYNYSSNEVRGECIAYEAFSYGGSSGSPVFAIEKGPKPGPGISFPAYRELKMVGINAGHLKVSPTDTTHSGISYMYKSSAILDLIDEAVRSVS